MLLCPAPRCPTSCLWYRWTCSQIRAGLCHSAPSVHRCLQRLWTRGLWSHRSSTLLLCVRICQLLRAGSHHSTPSVTGIHGERRPGVCRVAVARQHHRESGYVAVYHRPCSKLGTFELLIPLPDTVLLHADPALLLKLTQTYHNFLLPQELAPSIDPLLAVLSWEGPFDASTELATTSDHPLISAGITGCPYRMTTYREDDIASVDSVTVLHQYEIALHRMSTEILHSVFGREFFPSEVVDDAAPVPHMLRASTQIVAMGL